MKQIKGLLIGLITIVFVIGILGLVGILKIQGSFLVPELALLGILLSLNGISKRKILYGTLLAIYGVIFIIGIVTLFIATNGNFIAGLQILVGILIIISSISVAIIDKKSSLDV